MNSLRARLVLGVVLVAVVPPAVATWLLAGRIQEAVRGQARERLAASLDVVRAGLAADAARLEQRLAALARDPEIRRLHLVRSGDPSALAAALAERRALLGLDRLAVTGAPGAPVAGAATGPRPAALLPLDGERALVLAASAPIAYRGEAVGLVEGGLSVDSAYLEPQVRSSGLGLALRDGAGRVVVSNLPAGLAPARGALEDPAAPDGGSLIRAVALDPAAAPGLEIVGVASTASADAAIGALRATALLLAALGVALGIALGTWWSWQLARPVERLAAFAERVARGEWDEPLALHGVRELETLVAALDRMRGDLRGYRARLVAGERHAAWSEMARMVAHEVKNPLTPIAVSIADLERSYSQRRPDFPDILAQAVRIVGEEIATLRRLLGEFSELGRMPEPRPTPFPARELLDDLAALYAAEAAAGRLEVAREGGDATLVADRGLVRQALVNLVKNALEAIGPDGRVRVGARRDGADVVFRVADDGPGLDDEARARFFAPRASRKPGGSGLGLAIVERIVTDHGGTVAVESAPGRGTTVLVRLPAGAKEP